MKPTKEQLIELYINQRLSTDVIGAQFGYSGRTIRDIMAEYDIPRLGPTHLRKDKSATWNIGVTRTDAQKEANRRAHLGRMPHNKDQGRVAFICDVCGKEVFDKPYRKKRTCSKGCKDQLSHLQRGEDHWNYKDENAGYKQRKRHWAEYREWRKAVLARDDFTCAKCQKRGGRLTAHHVYSWSKYPEKRFDIGNGITLCWSCHWTFHRAYGHKHSTPEMLADWLTTLHEQPDATNLY